MIGCRTLKALQIRFREEPRIKLNVKLEPMKISEPVTNIYPTVFIVLASAGLVCAGKFFTLRRLVGKFFP